MADGNKRRGRPPLTDEQREERSIRRKAMAVKRQQKYAAAHPEKVKASRQRYYEPKVRIPIENKPILEQLLIDSGLSFTSLCLEAIEEKYSVTLRKPVDNDEP